MAKMLPLQYTTYNHYQQLPSGACTWHTALTDDMQYADGIWQMSMNINDSRFSVILRLCGGMQFTESFWFLQH